MSRAVDQHERRISKKLSWVLRHHAIDLGLPMKADGFVPLAAVLALKELRGVSLVDVQRIVAGNDKKRFALRQTRNDGAWHVRANQGHSGKQAAILNDDTMLTEIVDPSDVAACVHGTFRKYWPKIMSQGLSRMGRKHIHFTSKQFGSADIVSGMRASSEVLVHVDMAKAMAAGLRFFLSDNQVILCAGNAQGFILPEFFSHVQAVDKKTKAVTPLACGVEVKADVEEKKRKEKKSTCKERSFDYLLVLDFEATCDNTGKRFGPIEIIEFPVVAVNTRTLTVEFVFHQYVRPTTHPELTAFCTQLTGIEQHTVSQSEPFAQVHADFRIWLQAKRLTDKSIAFVTCGDWDLKTMYPKQCMLASVAPIECMARWINIKKVFKTKSGMETILSRLNLQLEGRHHSGIDDCKNLARCVIEMIRRGYSFAIT